MRRTGHALRATRVVELKRTMWSSGATLLALLLVFVRPALGGPCVLTVGSLYQLKSDAVNWTMQTSSGQSCIRGLRHKRVTIDTAKLISPPQSGQVKLLGPGFSYTAKSDFEGQDSFTVQVSGMLNGIRGSSDIRIIVSIGPNVTPQTSPTERSDRPPGDLSSAAQPNQNSTAQGTNQTRQVRPANADTSMSPSTRPARILPSQQGTGPLQQGTGTDQTIGVPQVRPALVLPQVTVWNALPSPSQQGTTCSGSNGGTNSSCSAPLQSSTGGVEVPGPSQTLFNNPFYSCVRNFYVATNGSDANNGTSPTTPWATIQHADTASRTGGDCINVAPGTYQQTVLIQHGGNAPTSTGYVVYRCTTMNACHILAPAASTYLLVGMQYGGNFVVFDGFEIDGNNSFGALSAVICIGSADLTAGTSSTQAGSGSHHIWVLNNIIHHCGQSGIQLNNREWFYSIHNTTYHNAWNSGFNGSGISYFAIQCVEAGGTNCFTSTIAGQPPNAINYTPSGNDIATFNGTSAWT